MYLEITLESVADDDPPLYQVCDLFLDHLERWSSYQVLLSDSGIFRTVVDHFFLRQHELIVNCVSNSM